MWGRSPQLIVLGGGVGRTLIQLGGGVRGPPNHLACLIVLGRGEAIYVARTLDGCFLGVFFNLEGLLHFFYF